MNNKKISILGCGWLGVPLSEHLIKNKYQVKGSTTTLEKLEVLSSKGISPFLLDLENLNSADFAFFEADILIVAVTSKNVNAFKELAEKVSQHGVKKVIYISSTSVYPFNNSTVTEDTTPLDTPLYQIEKLLSSNTSFQTTIIRFAGLVGPKRNPGLFFRGGKSVKMPDAHVNLIHLEDCIQIIHEIIIQNKWNQVYNGCSDTHPTKRDFYAKVAKAMDRTLIFETPETKRTKIVSNQKLKQELGYEFIFPDVEAMTF